MTKPATITLDAEQLELLAQRVAELLAEHLPPAAAPPPRRPDREGLMTAAAVAKWWGLDRAWVYDHARQLGVIKLGTGPRPRLRFDPEIVAAALRLPAPPSDPETGPVSKSTAIPRGRTHTVPTSRNQSYGRRTP